MGEAREPQLTPGLGGREATNRVDAQGERTGHWSEADPHGGVMVGAYIAGLREGVWRHLAKDGRLRSEGSFRGGRLHGDWTWYRANGVLLQRGAFVDEVKHGTWERWDAQGRPLDAGAYVDGRKSGEWTTWNPDGTVKAVKRHSGAR